ncbi:hypothetical protein JTE90_011027 [Oedothorax gibbosus]|uniref:Uncharacterized protein n=1 Tax=Oedothorax gibbosus TaxID=931172 RepID=A0AAV6VFC2_9ARAC|nr:hypothetical protein JTE90_011027 [Oedothorax gibbosus]
MHDPRLPLRLRNFGHPGSPAYLVGRPADDRAFGAALTTGQLPVTVIEEAAEKRTAPIKFISSGLKQIPAPNDYENPSEVVSL